MYFSGNMTKKRAFDEKYPDIAQKKTQKVKELKKSNTTQKSNENQNYDHVALKRAEKN